ncbi:hypothetical protein [Corallococcus terminator]|uniref:50S ribosomal protein L7/L12 n=1 Tax=Corallococcus terminator TaxID=2316733 RepID=A0A3A8IFF3_9BACT|nr:hypothetical protein [Corallococcus terminator]RKG76283.1 hypothetical protein D7V88_32485 [Corallococcus terminator]
MAKLSKEDLMNQVKALSAADLSEFSQNLKAHLKSKVPAPATASAPAAGASLAGQDAAPSEPTE